MTLPEKIKRMTEIASAIIEGESFDPTCPYCNTPNLVFSFTVKRPPKYGLFIECKNCQHRHHLVMTGKPKNFREELVLKEYQMMEDRASELAEREADDIEAKTN